MFTDTRPPIPQNMAKEWVSTSFVRALCAQAGLNISSWEWDDGLDLTVGSSKLNYAGVPISNIRFHLQLKSTSDWALADGKIAFRIKTSGYNRLAVPSADPVHLVLYTLPELRGNWIKSKSDNSVWSHGAYFYSFTKVKKLPDPNHPEQKTTIHVPAANRLTASELLRMYREAYQNWKTLR